MGTSIVFLFIELLQLVDGLSSIPMVLGTSSWGSQEQVGLYETPWEAGSLSWGHKRPYG
ncbi:hypothetical protein CDL15_Pgr006076 [Punica granatum]|uniref:Uncharacterized protein n=1 Tax=Punica granatum TaxID=22663 RepID=A0A218VTC2_PUNGR|nr:hypothetical protein CDL15_Pgr006076 [Punica granatum]